MKAAASTLFTGPLAALLLAAAPAPVDAASDKDEDVYQIIRATESRVWRLNRKTGEIAVCTLDGDNLLCTTSSQATTPPARTYQERQAEKAHAEAEEQARRERQKEKDLQFLDRVVAAFRILIGAAIERDSDSGK